MTTPPPSALDVYRAAINERVRLARRDKRSQSAVGMAVIAEVLSATAFRCRCGAYISSVPETPICGACNQNVLVTGSPISNAPERGDG